MKAIGYRVAGPISAAASLEDLDLPAPEPGPRDLRVAIERLTGPARERETKMSVVQGGGAQTSARAGHLAVIR